MRRQSRHSNAVGAVVSAAAGGNMLQSEVVQKELKLDKDQIDKIKQIATDIREKHQDDFAGLRDLSQEERGEKMRELMKKVGEETTKALADVFKPEQTGALQTASAAGPRRSGIHGCRRSESAETNRRAEGQDQDHQCRL